jgi:hypothetical protein
MQDSNSSVPTPISDSPLARRLTQLRREGAFDVADALEGLSQRLSEHLSVIAAANRLKYSPQEIANYYAHLARRRVSKVVPTGSRRQRARRLVRALGLRRLLSELRYGVPRRRGSHD